MGSKPISTRACSAVGLSVPLSATYVAFPAVWDDEAVGDADADAGADGFRRRADQPMGMSEEPAITLYRLQACPFCERVVRKLDEYGLDYQSRFVEPMHSDRDVVKRISGKRSVPAIVDENTGLTMSESGNIVEYLEKTYGGEL